MAACELLGTGDVELVGPLRPGSPSPRTGGRADGDHPGRFTREGVVAVVSPGLEASRRGTDRCAHLNRADVSRETDGADDPPLAGPFTRQRTARERIDRTSLAQVQTRTAPVQHEARVHHMTEAHSRTVCDRWWASLQQGTRTTLGVVEEPPRRQDESSLLRSIRLSLVAECTRDLTLVTRKPLGSCPSPAARTAGLMRTSPAGRRVRTV